jgi:hypothetical protein
MRRLRRFRVEEAQGKPRASALASRLAKVLCPLAQSAQPAGRNAGEPSEREAAGRESPNTLCFAFAAQHGGRESSRCLTQVDDHYCSSSQAWNISTAQSAGAESRTPVR